MKWIGQHVWDLISRFRSEVYLENISSGTVASGGNLGLDSNNKIVKDAGGSNYRYHIHKVSYTSTSTGWVNIPGVGNNNESGSFTWENATVMPYGGKVIKILSVTEETSTRNVDMAFYTHHSLAGLGGGATGSSFTRAGTSGTFQANAPSDWDFSAGEVIGFTRRDNTRAPDGCVMTFVIRYTI
jgi:hypothetical protein